MTDVHDNTAAQVDFHEVAQDLNQSFHIADAQAARKKAEEGNTLGKLWSDIVDDMLGARKPARTV